LVKVRQMSHKGDEQEDMSKQQLLSLLDKLGKNKHFLVNAETNTIIRNPNEITENMAITIMPVVAGGSTPSFTNNPKSKCYHQRTKHFDELECEETDKIIDVDIEICQDCGALVS